MGGAQAKTSIETIAAGANEIIERALRHHITVVHIEPGPRLVMVRYRRGGELYVANKLPKAVAEQLTRRFKEQAGLDLDDTDAPQTGRFELKLGRRTYTVEVDTIPVMHGEKITLSLHEVAKSAASLEELGLWGPALAEVKQALARPNGLIIISGRAVDSLNLTLSALIQTLGTTTLKTAFVNSLELPLPLNIKQLSTKPTAGLSVARQLAILGRDNFDVFGLSLINDASTGQTVADLARRHLILGGVLADGAAEAMTRLEYLKINFINPVLGIGQTFVRRLCEHCREAYQPSAVEIQQLGMLFQADKPAIMSRFHELEQLASKDGLGKGLPLGSSAHSINKLWKAKPHGCARCDHTGYISEIGLFEVLNPGVNTQKALRDGEPTKQVDQATIKDGMISLKVDCLIKALRGLIDLPTLLAAASKNSLNLNEPASEK